MPSDKKKIGLFFGTFNPIHVGHLIIANHLAENTTLDEIWLVVTPHNPFKKKNTLLENHHRLELVYRATESYPKLKPSDIEFSLPQPNYTVNTLAYLEEKYPDTRFCLIMGEDNLRGFTKWKNYEVILARYELFVYPRIGETASETALLEHPSVHLVDAPVIEISATAIRKGIAEGKNVRPLLPEVVWEYIDQMNFYKK